MDEEPDKDERQSAEKPAMDAPQEEFIAPEAVPSKPERFGGSDDSAQKSADRQVEQQNASR